jgi:hypothetical protein
MYFYYYYYPDPSVEIFDGLDAFDDVRRKVLTAP